MQFDFEIQRSTRHCAMSGRTLEPGEVFYSTLQREGAEIVRRDIAAEAWQGPPEAVFGWWKSRVPPSDTQRPKLAPNDVLWDLFEQLAGEPGQHGMWYVLTLLLIRRRMLRIEDRLNQRSDGQPDLLVVYCPQHDETYEVPEVVPDDEKMTAIQDQLVSLLYDDAV